MKHVVTRHASPHRRPLILGGAALIAVAITMVTTLLAEQSSLVSKEGIPRSYLAGNVGNMGAENTPVRTITFITPIPLQTFTASEDTRTITVEASNSGDAQLTYSARVVSFGHAAGLVIGNNNDYRNWGGLDERWVLSDITWYFITPDGSFYQWNKSPQTAFSTGPAIGKFPPSFHTDLSLLINQPDTDVLAAGNVFMNGNQLTVRVGLGLKSGDDYRNWGGLDERWVQSTDNTWYFITPDGSFYRWNKSPQTAFTTGPAIGKFSPSFYADLSLLMNQLMVTGSPFGVEVTVQDTAGNSDKTAFGVVRPVAGDTQVGNLFITESSMPFRSRQLLGGTLTDEFFQLHFLAENEDIAVTQLVLTADGQDAAFASSSIDRLELYKVGETTPFATATVGGCGSSVVPAYSFCANTEKQLVALKGFYRNVFVRARMRTDTDGAVSGKHVKLKVDAIVGAKAEGLLSGTPLSQNDGDGVAEGELFIGTSSPAPSQPIFGNDNVVVLSKVLSITNASPDAEGTAIPIGNSRAIGQFKFSVAANNNTKNGLNKFALGTVFFSVSAQNVGLGSSNFVGYSKANPTQVVLCYPYALDGTPIPEGGDATGNFLVSCAFSGSPVDNTIDSGSHGTFVLGASVNNAQVNSSLPSSLQVSLQNFSDSSFTSFGPVASHLTWQDIDNGGSEVFWWIESPETVVRSTKYGESGGVVRAHKLTVVVKPTASADAAVKNQKNISLVRFESRTDSKDILVTGFTFDAAQGSLTDAQNYTLWVDTDTNGSVDTILQRGVAAVSGKVTFANLLGGGYVVSKEKSVVFEVHADVSSSFLSNTLQLKFATTQANYLAAELLSDGSSLTGIKTDGVCQSTCQVTVTTAPSTIYTLRSQGNLYITKSSTPVRSRQLLGGTLGDSILRMTMRAEHEAIAVTHLEFHGAGIVRSVDRLELFKAGETTPFAFALVAACNRTQAFDGTYCVYMNSNQLVIEQDQETTVLVRPRIQSDEQGGTSGDQFFFYAMNGPGIDQFGYYSQPEAVGVTSSNALAINDEDGNNDEGEIIFDDIRSPDQTVVLSKVLSITNADPNANGTAIPTGNARQIGQFKFSAAAASNLKNGQNKWTLSSIIFNVNATNVLLGSGDQTSTTTSDFKIYNKADSSVKSTCTANGVSATGPLLLVTCSNIASALETAIDPGSDLTFVLEAEVVNGKISNSSTSLLQVSIQNFSDAQASVLSPTGSHIQWLDKDNGSSPSFLWIEYPETTINGTSYQN